MASTTTLDSAHKAVDGRLLSISADPYDFEIDLTRCALLIIDMQRDFLEPGGFGESLGNDVSLLRSTIAPNRRLLQAWREAGLLVIHTREGHRPDLADLPPAKKVRGRSAVTIGDAGRWDASWSAASPDTTSSPSSPRDRPSR